MHLLRYLAWESERQLVCLWTIICCMFYACKSPTLAESSFLEEAYHAPRWVWTWQRFSGSVCMSLCEVQSSFHLTRESGDNGVGPWCPLPAFFFFLVHLSTQYVFTHLFVSSQPHPTKMSAPGGKGCLSALPTSVSSVLEQSQCPMNQTQAQRGKVIFSRSHSR